MLVQIHSAPIELFLSVSGTGIQPPKTYILQTGGETVATHKLDEHFNRTVMLRVKDALLVSNYSGRVKASGKRC